MEDRMGSRQQAEARGRRAETLCAFWLRIRGWRLLARRVRTRMGEVALLARRGKMVAFIEVKARTSAADLDFAIDEHRLSPAAHAPRTLAPNIDRPGGHLRLKRIQHVPGAVSPIRKGQT